MSPDRRHVAILGAGPVGLDAALAASEAGFPFTLYESGARAAANVRAWGHVRLFSPWELNVSPRMRRGLERAGVPAPRDEECPTGHELADRILDPVARLPEIARRLEPETRVDSVSREGLLKHEAIGAPGRAERPFRLLLTDSRGRERVERADVVLDCTGTYGNPNALGDGGIPAPGERALDGEIRRRIPDLARGGGDWAGRTILLVGAGHSAQTAARDLTELSRSAPGTRVVWALRRRDPDWGAVRDDPLPERARLTTRARQLVSGTPAGLDVRRGVVVDRLQRRNGRIRVHLRAHPTEARKEGEGPGPGDYDEPIDVDRILSLTGSVGDHTLYRQLQVHECYATSGPMKLSAALLGQDSADCLEQTGHGAETLVNPEPNFFLLGEKSYGRHKTFLMRVGWEQVDDVFGLLDGG